MRMWRVSACGLSDVTVWTHDATGQIVRVGVRWRVWTRGRVVVGAVALCVCVFVFTCESVVNVPGCRGVRARVTDRP